MPRVRAIHCALFLASACHAPANTAQPPAPVEVAALPVIATPVPPPEVRSAPTLPTAVAPPPAPITLALLDAMFADEQFVGELRSRLALTDQQIRQLRIRARAATAALTESRLDARRLTTGRRLAARDPRRRSARTIAPPRARALEQRRGRQHPGTGHCGGQRRPDRHSHRRQRPRLSHGHLPRRGAHQELRDRHRLPRVSAADRVARRDLDHLQPDLDPARRAVGEG